MKGIHKIMTHLWFDIEAAEAGAFYLKVFQNNRLLSRRTIFGTPSGDVETLTLEVEDINLMLLSAGPYFKINPSVSFMKYGVSWQIIPTVMNDMMHEADPVALDRVTQAFLQMKKFDLAKLERVYKGGL